MVGFTVPFKRGTGVAGFFHVERDDVAIATADLKSLILTNRGERPMRRTFGCSLRDFLFQQLDVSELRSLVSDRIIEQVSAHLPYLRLESIDVLADETRSLLNVNVVFSIAGKVDKSGTVAVSIGG